MTNAYVSKAGGESNYIQMNLSSAAWEIITIAWSCLTWLPCCEIPTPSFLQANEAEAPKMLSLHLFKAFDTVDRNTLLGFSLVLMSLLTTSFKSYLSGGVQTVVVDGFKSSLQAVDKGGPQGSI